MKTEKVKLSQIQVNGANPRTITKEKFSKLVTSILVLPKMLELRPIVVDNTFTALGTAASTPKDVKVGYVFKNCRLTADANVTKVYLGRPWRPYAATVFIGCEMGKHICPAGWDNWRNPDNEKTARYAEFGNTGDGSSTEGRVKWSGKLKKDEAGLYDDFSYMYSVADSWNPSEN